MRFSVSASSLLTEIHIVTSRTKKMAVGLRRPFEEWIQFESGDYAAKRSATASQFTTFHQAAM